MSAVRVFVKEEFLNIVEREVSMERLSERAPAEIHTQLHRLATRSGVYRNIPQQFLADDYAVEILRWLETLKPATLLARIIHILGEIPGWLEASDKQTEPLALAAEEFVHLFLRDPALVHTILDWAYSSKAHGTYQFGLEVGKGDRANSLFAALIAKAVASGETDFVRGYLAGAEQASHLDLAQLNTRLDELEQEAPRVAFKLAHVLPRKTRAFHRALAQVRLGRLSPGDLRSFSVWVGSDKTTIEDAKQALAVLMPMQAESMPETAAVALEFVAYQYYRSADPSWTATPDPEFDDLSWAVLDACTNDSAIQGHWRGKTLNALADRSTPQRVARMLVKGMCGESFHLRQEADQLLATFAESRPQVAMDALGEILQDKELSQNVPYQKLSCFRSLPPDVLGGWLDAHGTNGAFLVANYIPAPYLDTDKQPKLHPLTELFLDKYADEDRVFHHYAGQLHSLQSYNGDIVQLKLEEAEVARKFLDHPVRRVRDWAVYEIREAEQGATQYRSILDRQRL